MFVCYSQAKESNTMASVVGSGQMEACESPPVLILHPESTPALEPVALPLSLPRPIALVPPPVVTRSGRVIKPVKDAYIDKNRRSITRLVVHDAKQSMLDDMDGWQRVEASAHPTLHWPVVNVHDTYQTVLAEYTRVHLHLFGTPPLNGDEGVPDGYDEDVSYVEGDSQADEEDVAAEESSAAEEEDEEDEEDSSESEDEEDDDAYRTPPRVGRTRPRSLTITAEDEDVFAPPPAPVKRARGVEGEDAKE